MVLCQGLAVLRLDFFLLFLLIIFVLVGGFLSSVTINDSSPDTIPRQSRLKNF